MNYKVLYRKYRPTNFDNLVGQNHIKQILLNSIINDKIAHAYIFTGPRGTGKTSTAKIFARSLNCSNSNNGIPCGECVSCLNFDTSPDIIEMDAASNNSVDDIRNIIENVSIAPTFSKYKIYIIDEVHMLTTSAWNAFLKTLEEPPLNVIFILATTDIQKVPITVLSRCQRFDFQRIDRDEIKNNLIYICNEEHIDFEDEALAEIAYLSDGCMRDALSILDQLSKVSDKVSIDVIKENYGTVSTNDLDEIYNSILQNDIDSLVNKLKDIKETGIDIKVFINKILENFIDKAIKIKKKNLSSNAFNQLKSIINSLNNLLMRINGNSDGFLLLELELVSFINDETNKISSREIGQIISREIISNNEKVDVNNLIKKNENIYNVCDEFINVRINNSFVGASKDYKNQLLGYWKSFIDYVVVSPITELVSSVKNSMIVVASDKYAIVVVKSDTIKVVANSKLYDIENYFNNLNKCSYKLIFITDTEWKNILSTFDKNKNYELMDEDKFINKLNDSVGLAENIFGESVNIE